MDYPSNHTEEIQEIANNTLCGNISRSACGDNHGEVLSKAALTQADEVLILYVIPVVCICGIVGNTRGLIAIWRMKLTNSAFVYLCGLTVADILSLIAGVMISLTRVIDKIDNQLGSYLRAQSSPFLDKYLKQSTNRLVTFTVLLLSLERCVVLFRPLAVSRSFVNRKAKLLVIVVYVFIGILYIPSMAMYEVSERLDKNTNTTAYLVTLRQWAVELPGFVTGYTFCIVVLTMYVPVPLILIVNVAIVVQLKRIHKFQWQFKMSEEHYKKKQMNERTITLTHLTLCFFFLLTSLSLAILFSMRRVADSFSETGDMYNLYLLLLKILLVLSYCSSANDFIVFYLFSRQFRQHFCGKGICHRSTEQPPGQTIGIIEISTSGQLNGQTDRQTASTSNTSRSDVSAFVISQ